MACSQLRIALAAMLASGLLAACSAPGQRSDGRLSVVVAESPWGAVASVIGGSHVAVTSVLRDASIDPHEYAPSAPVAAEVATADVVIENGLGYDSFMDQLLGTGAAHARRTVVAASVLGVHGDAANPHLWYWIARVPEVAAAIERTFAAADPSHAASYEVNLARFDASMSGLDTELAQIRASHHGTAVAQTERVAGYLLAQAGLEVVSPDGFALAIEEGHEPSAADTRSMTALLAHGGVAALVVNTQTSSRLTDDLQAEARAGGIPVVAVTELVDPVGSTYVAWQQRQIDALRRALGPTGSA